MVKHTVTIKVEVPAGGGPKVLCDPDPLEIQKENSVLFVCDYPFAVHFSQATPFSKMSHSGKKDPEKSQDQKKYADTSSIPLDMPYGTYKYFVAVCYDGQVLTADPDIIIVP